MKLVRKMGDDVEAEREMTSMYSGGRDGKCKPHFIRRSSGKEEAIVAGGNSFVVFSLSASSGAECWANHCGSNGAQGREASQKRPGEGTLGTDLWEARTPMRIRVEVEQMAWGMPILPPDVLEPSAMITGRAWDTPVRMPASSNRLTRQAPLNLQIRVVFLQHRMRGGCGSDQVGGKINAR